MAQHKATISWRVPGPNFLKGQFSREHTWTFDGGAIVSASSSPSVVPPPHSNPLDVDPEEAFVASISSCHMLTFLWLASRQGFAIDSYTDEAVGTTTRDEHNRTSVSAVTLRPQIEYSGTKRPTPEQIRALHDAAHEQCYVANSVRTVITVE